MSVPADTTVAARRSFVRRTWSGCRSRSVGLSSCIGLFVKTSSDDSRRFRSQAPHRPRGPPVDAVSTRNAAYVLIY